MLVNGYCTLSELKGHIIANGGGDFTPEDDTNLEVAINAVSRWLDNHFDTSFYARTETRHYDAQWYDLLYVDDLLTITALKTDENADGDYETEWASSDYWLEPRNAATNKRPYRQVRTRATGNYSFPVSVEYGVEITGTWGYCTEANRPAEIKQFTLLMSHRLWKRKDAIFGVAGTPALGVQIIQAQITADEDLMLLLTGIGRRGF